MVLLDEDNDYDGEAGIAFTSKAMYYWLEGDDFRCEIKYDEIASVDFDEESITVEDTDGTCYEIICNTDDDDGEKYSRYMYNMVMDIKEMLEEE